MCRQPAIRAPFKGFLAPNSSRSDISPGISASANFISLRPHSAREISFTLYFKCCSVCVLIISFQILREVKDFPFVILRNYSAHMPLISDSSEPLGGRLLIWELESDTGYPEALLREAGDLLKGI